MLKMRATVLLLGCLHAQAGLWGKTEKKKKRRKAPDPHRFDGEMRGSGVTKRDAIHRLVPVEGHGAMGGHARVLAHARAVL